ncbi:MAG: TIM barrel protein [Planctomycetota bacterium]
MSSRRKFLKVASSAAITSAIVDHLGRRLDAEQRVALPAEIATGNQVKHSVCKWCYGGIPLENLCEAGQEFGLQSVEIIGPEQKTTLDKFGMTCAMVNNPTVKAQDGKQVGGISRGWNEAQYHDVLVEVFENRIKEAAEVGLNNVICFSGNRRGMDDEQGLRNCAEGLKRLMPLCEKLGVTLSMELLNSKVNHKDYMCDRTQWGVELCKLVGSDNFKLLYDIYHMQIMEGDVISTIKKSNRYISHYHTAGVPGRAEIDETQELNYPAIIKAILETGYRGFVGQEFIPRRDDRLASLKQGVEICSVNLSE